MLKIKALAILGFFATAGLSFAQQPISGQELLAKASAAYRNLKSYYFEGVMVYEAETEAMQERIKVETPIVMAAVRPGKLRDELKRKRLTVSDGQSTWVYSTQLNQYTKRKAAAMAGEGTGELETGFMSKYWRMTEGLKQAEVLREEVVELEGKAVECYVVEASYEPAAESSNFEDLPKLFWIDKKRHIVLKDVSGVIIKAPQPGAARYLRQTTMFSIARINEPVPDDLFAFNVPEGAREADEPNLPGMRKATTDRDEAADFTLKGLDGKETSLKSLRGKVVLLDFWASWCAPCREELPKVERLHRELKDKGLVVLGINVGESAEIAREFVRKYGLTFTTLLDPYKEVTNRYRAMAIPLTVVIDRDGKISSYNIGLQSESGLRDALRKAGID